jgi:hypothetical protein
MSQPPSPKRLLGGIGMILGLLALGVAFLSPKIAGMIDPPPRPIEETVVDLAGRLAAAAKAKAKGEVYEAPAVAREPLPSRFLYPGVIIAGIAAAGLGIGAAIRSEDRFFSRGAIALGTGAALVQWSMMLVGVLALILLVVAVMSFFGASP